MISVCMATKNGANYIAEQLDSILPQLQPTDEVIITDDCSTDNTVSIVRAYRDHRILLLQNNFPSGIAKTFQVSLEASRGDYIFLADQDDVWVSTKVSAMARYLQTHDLVVSDCLLVDHALKIKRESFFSVNNSGRGLIKNIVKNSYMGCCMAFNRDLLIRALPFPKDIPLHDFWIGLIAELYFNVYFIPDVLVYHRRHFSNASSSGEISPFSLPRKVVNRYRMIKNLFLHKSYAA
jgi:glycosyltransferase involved in cell wall biosynthesis